MTCGNKGPERIFIVGSQGSGKTTVARAIGRELGLPVFHCDKIFYKAGWELISTEEVRGKYLKIIEGKKWICDGIMHSMADEFYEKGDILIHLKTNRFICLFNVLKRHVQSVFKGRIDVPESCDNKLYFSLIKKTWMYPKTMRPVIEKEISQKGNMVRVHEMKVVNKKSINNLIYALSFVD